MAMEGLRSSVIATALLFLLTLVVLATAATSGSCGDDAAAAEQCHDHDDPVAADEPYALITFENKDGEEMRLVADQRSEPAAYGFANRSGNWFYAIREAGGNGKPGRRLPLPLLSHGGGSRTEGLWNTLGALANSTTASSDSDPAADEEEEEHYVLVGLQTGGGDKIRLVAVADQRYVYVTGYAKGFSRSPRWSFRDGERHRILLSSGGDGSGHDGSSHAEVVASNLLAALIKEGSSCF